MRTLFVVILLGCFHAGNLLVVSAQRAVTVVPATKQSVTASRDSIEINTYDNKIVVRNAPINSRLEIYSLVGIRVKEIEMKQSDGEYTVNIAKGYYIVRIGETVCKIAIR